MALLRIGGGTECLQVMIVRSGPQSCCFEEADGRVCQVDRIELAASVVYRRYLKTNDSSHTGGEQVIAPIIGSTAGYSGYFTLDMKPSWAESCAGEGFPLSEDHSGCERRLPFAARSRASARRI